MLQWKPGLATLLFASIAIALVVAHASGAGRSFGWG
jgi:hypothetical protein